MIYSAEASPAVQRIATGAIVRVKAGRFAGWEGVCRWSSSDRVAVLLSLLGRDVKVQVPRADVVSA